uniref:Inositol hexakisphosphate and diphosphoinositol-pentakisphosphate kinase n=1 Tax=Ditylenchus dipsaci TaxID=166011 RepID=A0A915E1K8_9BILA
MLRCTCRLLSRVIAGSSTQSLAWPSTSSSAVLLTIRKLSSDPSQDYFKRQTKKSSNVVYYFWSGIVFSLGVAFLAVPAYRIFCEQTSISGVTQVAQDFERIEKMQKVKNRLIRVEFNADVPSSMRWHFKPAQREIYVHPGETALAFYTAKNPTDKPIIGISSYNLSPYEAAYYFNKIQCFCFEEQILNPGEEVDLPVFFYIDPDFANDPALEFMDQLLLSYTFFEAKSDLKLPSPFDPTNRPMGKQLNSPASNSSKKQDLSRSPLNMSSYPPNDGGVAGMKKIIIGDWLDFLIFPEEVVLNEPVENWPLCDCLVSFHSTDFPLRKAIEYERLRRPYVLNDLNRQFDLLDRRKVFRTLARAGIDHPRHCVLVRDEQGKVVGGELTEHNDHIEVNGMVFNKPFVEKPISAEDHNVYIYYPSSVGGGSQRLFRKVNDRSSWYSPTCTVRAEGSYIYEEFIPADGTDVKVYAVGPYYAHAEARKAPGLDGKVERDADGKEVRYPVILSAREKMIARRVVLAFGQTVCGFDLLRANGRSFVHCKNTGNTILRRLASSLSIPWHIPFQDDDPPLVSTLPARSWN